MISWEGLVQWMTGKGAGALEFLWKVVLSILVYLVVSKLLKYICKRLKRDLERFHVEQAAASFVISLVRYGILGITIVSVVIQFGVEASSIAALVASAGVGISLALQGGLSNFVGGILILFLKPFRAGDYIICPSEGVEGTVQKIEMYYTTIMSIDNRMILVPNSNLTNHTITNVTAMNRRKLEITVGISYQANLRKAKEVLEKLVEHDSRFQEEDRQFFVDGLEDSSVTIGFRAWVATEDYIQTRWDMLEKIKLTFDEEGIEIPYNQLDVHVKGQI